MNSSVVHSELEQGDNGLIMVSSLRAAEPLRKSPRSLAGAHTGALMVFTDGSFLFKHQRTKPRIALRKLPGGCQPDDAAACDGHMKLRHADLL